MIRAKTLLSCIIVVSAAAITFTLNASHDGFVPDSALNESPVGGSALSATRSATPSQVIAQLPKLAPPPTATPEPVTAIAPTVIEVDNAPSDGVRIQQVTAVSKTTAAKQSNALERTDTTADQNAVTDAVTANRAFAALAGQSTNELPNTDNTRVVSTKEQTIPLPVRVPVWAKTQKRTDTDRVAFKRKTALKRTARHRKPKPAKFKQASAQKKKALQKTSGLFGLKSKPVRHRKPFDSNRN